MQNRIRVPTPVASGRACMDEMVIHLILISVIAEELAGRMIEKGSNYGQKE